MLSSHLGCIFSNFFQVKSSDGLIISAVLDSITCSCIHFVRTKQITPSDKFRWSDDICSIGQHYMQSLNHYVEIVHTCRAMNFRTIRMYSVSVQGDSKLRECLLTKHTWFTPLRIIYLLTISDQKTLDKLQCV